MIMITFEQAKDQVAMRHGHADWKIAEYRVGRNDIDKMYTEAAELYAKSKWDEACDEMEQAIVDNLSEEIQAAREAKKPEFKP